MPTSKEPLSIGSNREHPQQSVVVMWWLPGRMHGCATRRSSLKPPIDEKCGHRRHRRRERNAPDDQTIRDRISRFSERRCTRRTSTALARSIKDPTARTGCNGAQIASEPDTPSSHTTILLQTGQPTARMLKALDPNTLALRRRLPDRPTAIHAPVSSAVATSTGNSHHRTGVIRVNQGVLSTSVGTPTATALPSPATTAQARRRVSGASRVAHAATTGCPLPDVAGT